MTQATGALAKLVLGFETTFGTAAAAGFVIPINSSTLKMSRNQTQPATITGNINPVEPYDGNSSVSGEINVPIDSLAFWYMLKAALGVPVTTGASSPYAHAFKAGTTRPSLTLEHQFTDLATPKYFLYTGCKISTISLSAGDDGELVATFGVVGTSEVIGTSPFDADPTDLGFARLKNNQLTLKEGGSTISNAKMVDCSINFNVDTGQYVIGGGGVLGSIPEGVMTITGNLNALFEDTVLLQKALDSTESSLELTFEESATSKIVILFPEIKYALNSPGIEGPMGIAVSLPFAAYYTNASEETSLLVTLSNPEAHA
ncbi:MAG: hypothetical protein KAI40_03385 [Desulfobacterales bacterium]|nr:hypothetical protein [Desulfobacterales bacterium]